MVFLQAVLYDYHILLPSDWAFSRLQLVGIYAKCTTIHRFIHISSFMYELQPQPPTVLLVSSRQGRHVEESTTEGGEAWDTEIQKSYEEMKDQEQVFESV